MKKFLCLLFAMSAAIGLNACSTGDDPTAAPPVDNPDNSDPSPSIPDGKTLIVYYSYTNNIHTIVSDLMTQREADAVRIQTAEKGIDYAANNYAIGSAQIQSILDNPANVSSYPAIEPVNISFSDYSTVMVATPLWWNHMAAPMQTFLFMHGAEMAGKRIGLIVSSASSGISCVEADARRLIPGGNFISPSLWIRSSQTPSSHTLISAWLREISSNK